MAPHDIIISATERRRALLLRAMIFYYILRYFHFATLLLLLILFFRYMMLQRDFQSYAMILIQSYATLPHYMLFIFSYDMMPAIQLPLMLCYAIISIDIADSFAMLDAFSAYYADDAAAIIFLHTLHIFLLIFFMMPPR